MHNKNVYILGAGFSSDAGAPTLSDFLRVARRLYVDPSSGLTDEDRAGFSHVWKYRSELAGVREAIELDLEHVEHLLGILDLEATVDEEKEFVRAELAGC